MIAGGGAMASARTTWLRDLAAVAVVVVACPVALFGGSMVGCVGQGFSSACALNAILISPILLLLAGVVAGLLTRGLVGLLLVMGGVILGMTSIPVLTAFVGRPVPVDPISGFIATVWFMFPVLVGYVGARLVIALVRRAPER
jgi:hypothetical protein